jgi:hypothetical protein
LHLSIFSLFSFISDLILMLFIVIWFFNPFYWNFPFDLVPQYFINHDFVNLSSNEFKRLDWVRLYFFRSFLELILLILFFYGVILISCVRLRVSHVNLALHWPIFFYNLFVFIVIYFLSYYQINQGLTQLLDFSYFFKSTTVS